MLEFAPIMPAFCSLLSPSYYSNDFTSKINASLVSWSKVFSMGNCSLYLGELFLESVWMTSWIRTGILSQVIGVPRLPLGLLESLPPPQEREVQPKVDCSFGIGSSYKETKAFLFVTALIAWLACLAIIHMYYYYAHATIHFEVPAKGNM